MKLKLPSQALWLKLERDDGQSSQPLPSVSVVLVCLVCHWLPATHIHIEFDVDGLRGPNPGLPSAIISVGSRLPIGVLCVVVCAGIMYYFV